MKKSIYIVAVFVFAVSFVGTANAQTTSQQQIADLSNQIQTLLKQVQVLQEAISQQKMGPDTSMPTTNKGTNTTPGQTGIDNQEKIGGDSSLPTTNKGVTPVPVPSTAVQTTSTMAMCGRGILYMENISKGDSDDILLADAPIIKSVQDFLKQKGYFKYYTSTGYFGPITESALRDWQRANSLTVSGQIDEATFNKIKQSMCSTAE